MKDSHLLVFMLVISLATILLIGLANIRYSTIEHYKTGTIMDIYKAKNKVKVKIYRGPRVFVHNFGTYSIEDFNCGDRVDMVMVNKKITIIDKH